ncbi:MAG: hypothetical protein AAGA80_12675 [Cyanobacteria bacterium P01_F01_bin.143]
MNSIGVMVTTNPNICDNRFPNCVRMELEIKPIDDDSFDLVANIRFGEHTIRTNSYGEATFGFRKGKLKVELDQGEIPLKNIKLDKRFQTEIEIEFKQQEGKEKQFGGNVGWRAGGSAASKKTKTEGQEFKYKEYQVRTEGGNADPCWIFEAKYQEFLEGLLQDTELAIVDVTEKPCRLVAIFNIEAIEDICLTNGKLLGIKNITKKRLAIVERWIANYWIENLLQNQSYLSRVELTHG